MAGERALLEEREGGVLTMTLNRPHSLNAFTHALLDDLFAALRQAHADPTVRCVVITGAGERAFSAGADIKEGSGAERDEEQTYRGTMDYYSRIFSTVRGVEKPIIAAVNGVAAGAGQSLALACDLRIAADSANFVGAFVRIGISPDTGQSMSLPALVGLSRASEIIWSGRRVPAHEALALGMVNRVVPRAELHSATAAWAGELAALPTRAIGLTKRAFNRALYPNMDAQLDLEARLVARAEQTHDAREGIAAFLERRDPRFTGR